MAEYYVIRNKNTGFYFRGKGANRWGKYLNQASIYRRRSMAESSMKDVVWHGEKTEIVPIQIVENAVEVVHGRWEQRESGFVYFCSNCEYWTFQREAHEWHYCPNCGTQMDGIEHE